LEDGLPSASGKEWDGLGRPSSEYWLDQRPLPTVTLEQIIVEQHLDRIDVLKLDCEGSEFSILENTTSLDRVGAIIGEYHGRDRFMELVARRFADWQLRIIRDGDPGTFWLVKKRNRGQHPEGTRGHRENSEFGARNSDSTIPNSAFQIPNSESQDLRPKT
jgi:methyltransferase FkbM-like protein